MYRAVVSFTGKIRMAMGEVGEISDQALAKDLLRAGYITEVKPENKTKGKGKKNEDQGA